MRAYATRAKVVDIRGRMMVVDGELIIIASVYRKLKAIGYDVSYTHLTKVFKGTRRPSVSLLRALAKVLNRTVDKVLVLLDKTAKGEFKTATHVQI